MHAHARMHAHAHTHTHTHAHTHTMCTSITQIQAALSELAEAQLALLAGIMPHHAIQFLALESTAAVSTHAHIKR